MSLETLLEELKSEEQKVLQEISDVVHRDQEAIISVIAKGEQLEHDALVKLHTYWNGVKAIIERVEEVLKWKSGQ